MDCFNHLCPSRQNTTSSLNRCECVMCPHRIEMPVTYAVSNRTMTADEIARMTNDPNCGRPESEQENGCAGCNLRKLLGQPAGFGGGCCGWALSGAPAEVAIEILETALAVEEENGGVRG